MRPDQPVLKNLSFEVNKGQKQLGRKGLRAARGMVARVPPKPIISHCLKRVPRYPQIPLDYHVT